MSERDFFFSLDMSDEPESDRLLGDVARTVLGSVGYAVAVTDELTGALRAAIADRVAASGQKRCTVRFLAGGGVLQVVVAGVGAPEWRTSRPLPAP